MVPFLSITRTDNVKIEYTYSKIQGQPCSLVYSKIKKHNFYQIRIGIFKSVLSKIVEFLAIFENLGR